jgi:hypothetical protein
VFTVMPNGGYLVITGQAVDRNGKPVTRQPPRDHRPQALPQHEFRS